MGKWNVHDLNEVTNGYVEALLHVSEFQTQTISDVANAYVIDSIASRFLRGLPLHNREKWDEFYSSNYSLRQLGWFLCREYFPPQMEGAARFSFDETDLRRVAEIANDSANLGKPTIVQDGDYVLLIVREG